MSSDDPPRERERVPLFGSWRNAYAAVVIFFCLNVAFFVWFSRAFS